jgi:hypothetical protein
MENTVNINSQEIRLLTWAINVAIESEMSFIDCHFRFGKVLPESAAIVAKSRRTIKKLTGLRSKIRKTLGDANERC